MSRQQLNYAQIDFLSTDKTSDLDTLVLSSKATQDAISDAISGLPAPMSFKGSKDCSGNPNYPAATAGDVYYVSVAGKIGGASGRDVDVNQLIICDITNAGGDQATVGADFTIVSNKDSIVTSSSASSTDVDIAVFDSTSGKIIKDSGTKIADLVSTSTEVNGHALSGNVTVTASDVGLGLLFREATVTASALQTVFSLTHLPISNSDYVIVNGLVADPEDYNITTDDSTGTIVTLTSACIGGEKVSIRYMY